MTSRTRDPVSFIFRISELRESGAFAPAQDNGQWTPTDAQGANVIVAGGATSIMWLCDGKSIRTLNSANDSELLRRLTPYKTYSMFFCQGKGFQVLRDHAVTTRREEGWLPLTFDHDKHDFSSYLTNARCEPALHCHQANRQWVRMLLPDVYHDRWEVPAPHGGLKGELAIFLALVAFAMPMDRLQQDLPAMFHSKKWQQYDMANGRIHQRGVVVEIWTYSSRYGGSSAQELEAYEERGMYYA